MKLSAREAAIAIIAVAFSLTFQHVTAKDGPRKATLWIAVDDSPRCVMVKRELDRDWFRPNPAIVLTKQQRTQGASVASQMRIMQVEVRECFTIVYVDPPQFVRVPAVKVNHGRWETLPPQATAYETMPLRTVHWYAECFKAVMDRGEGQCWYSAVRIEPLPPWKEWIAPKLTRRDRPRYEDSHQALSRVLKAELP